MTGMEALKLRLKALAQPFDVAIAAKRNLLLSGLDGEARDLIEEIESLVNEKTSVLVTRSFVEGVDVGKALSR